MRKILSTLLLASTVLIPVRGADDPSFIDKAKHAVGLLFAQNSSGGMEMRCTVTAYQQTKSADSYIYRFLSAAHCVGPDRVDKERSANPANIPFFISFDEVTGPKRFWAGRVLWVGYQSKGQDFSVFEVKSSEDWPTIPLGDEKQLKAGAPYWNIASPLGLGLQTQEGIIASINLNRPLIDGDINWSHTLVLQQSGVNGGSSGSPIISKDTHAIVGTLVGVVGGSTIIAIPISRFHAVQKAVDAKKYKYWQPELNLNDDGSEDETAQ